MPLDEREATFEKALSRHLRGDCADAETLAAYHERALTAEEMVVWKKHISGCGACQKVLAQLERTEGVGVEAGAEMTGSDGTSGLHNVLPVAARAAEPTSAPAGVRQAAQMPQRGRTWKWAAPTGAIAAGLLVWLSLSEWQRSTVHSPAPVQVAENRTQAEPLMDKSRRAEGHGTPPVRAANESAKQESGVKLKAAAPTAGQTPALQQPLSKMRRQDRAGNGPAQEAHRAVPSKKGARAEQKERAELKDEIASNKKTQAAKATDAMTESVQVQAENAEALTGTPLAPRPAPPAAAAAEGTREVGKSAVAGSAAQQEASGGREAQYTYRIDADASAQHTVVSADGKNTWRLGPDGEIFVFDAKSAGWHAQSSGIAVALTGGSAPTEKICWVAGRQGTILLTVDGGEHWRKVPSPIPGDVGAITARDAVHATVWDAEKRTSYETSDAGASWTPQGP